MGLRFNIHVPFNMNLVGSICGGIMTLSAKDNISIKGTRALSWLKLLLYSADFYLSNPIRKTV